VPDEVQLADAPALGGQPVHLGHEVGLAVQGDEVHVGVGMGRGELGGHRAGGAANSAEPPR